MDLTAEFGQLNLAHVARKKTRSQAVARIAVRDSHIRLSHAHDDQQSQWENRDFDPL